MAYSKKYDRVLRKAMSEFSKLGGYPICHKTPREATDLLARQILDTVVNRTIDSDPLLARRQGPKHATRSLIKETFRLICRYAGQAVTPRRMAEEIGQVLSSTVHADAITEAVQFLTDSMLVHQIAPLELLLRKQGHPCKLCLCDHFIRNAWLQEAIPISPEELATRPESVSSVAGHIVESVVGYHLCGVSGLEVAWLPERPSQAEVDFVLTIGTHRLPVEVKYRRGSLRPPDFAPVMAFCGNKNYEAPFGIIITQETTVELDSNVMAIPLTALLAIR